MQAHAAAGEKCREKERVMKVLSDHLLNNLRKTNDLHHAESGTAEVRKKTTLAAIRKGEERRRVEKVLSEHLLNKMSRTANSALVANVLTEHLRGKQNKVQETLPAAAGPKERVAQMLTEHLQFKMQQAKESSCGPDCKTVDKKRVAEMLHEHLRSKIQKAKGLDQSVDTAQINKKRVADMLSEHLRAKMQLHAKKQQTASSSPSDSVDSSHIDKPRVVDMLTRHLSSKVQRARQLQRTARDAAVAEASRVDRKRAADVLSKHLRTKIQKARDLQAEREATGRQRQQVRAVLTSHLEAAKLKARPAPQPLASLAADVTTAPPAVPAPAREMDLVGAGLSAASGTSGGAAPAAAPLPSGEHLQRLFDVFLETLDMDKAAVYRQLGTLSHVELQQRLIKSKVPNVTSGLELTPLGPMLRSLFLHVLTAPDDAPDPAASSSRPATASTFVLKPPSRAQATKPQGGSGKAGGKAAESGELMEELRSALKQRRERVRTGAGGAGAEVRETRAAGWRKADPACPRECLLEQIRTGGLPLRHVTPPADAALARARERFRVAWPATTTDAEDGVHSMPDDVKEAEDVDALVPPPLASPSSRFSVSAQALAPVDQLSPPPPPPVALPPSPPPSLAFPPPPSSLLLLPPPPTLALPPTPPVAFLAPPPQVPMLSPPAPGTTLISPLATVDSPYATAVNCDGSESPLDLAEDVVVEGLIEEALPLSADVSEDDLDGADSPAVESYDGEEELEHGVLAFD